MNIQISGLPDNQKIKSINFNIVFDSLDDNHDTVTRIDTVEVLQKPSTVVPSISESANMVNTVSESAEAVEVQKPAEIDISNRVAKIDPNMLDESF